MQSKLGFMTLSAIATLMLFSGTTAEAQEQTSTDKKEKEPIVYEVIAGDTLSAIADKYTTSYIRLFNANDAIVDPNLIDVGNKIRIPTEHEQLPDRFGALPVPQQVAYSAAAGPVSYAAPVTSQPAATSGYVARGSSAGNTYVWGNCTWYAKEMRPDLPNMLGNGGSWVANAAARGIPTGNVPRVGAIAEQPGHVAYVEAVNGATVSISEMNYNGGIGQVHRREAPASMFRYIY